MDLVFIFNFIYFPNNSKINYNLSTCLDSFRGNNTFLLIILIEYTFVHMQIGNINMMIFKIKMKYGYKINKPFYRDRHQIKLGITSICIGFENPQYRKPKSSKKKTYLSFSIFLSFFLFFKC